MFWHPLLLFMGNNSGVRPRARCTTAQQLIAPSLRCREPCACLVTQHGVYGPRQWRLKVSTSVAVSRRTSADVAAAGGGRRRHGAACAAVPPAVARGTPRAVPARRAAVALRAGRGRLIGLRGCVAPLLRRELLVARAIAAAAAVGPCSTERLSAATRNGRCPLTTFCLH